MILPVPVEEKAIPKQNQKAKLKIQSPRKSNSLLETGGKFTFEISNYS